MVRSRGEDTAAHEEDPLGAEDWPGEARQPERKRPRLSNNTTNASAINVANNATVDLNSHDSVSSDDHGHPKSRDSSAARAAAVTRRDDRWRQETASAPVVWQRSRGRRRRTKTPQRPLGAGKESTPVGE